MKKSAQKNGTCKAIIAYPCQWLYKVIGMDHEQLHRAILDVVGHSSCKISLSKSSSSGKYLCLNVEVTVRNEEERNSIYMDLKSHPHIKIVL
ncbi:MAG: DUF493 domain-containing protein [Deltaproteobacteria bacterium]|nr:DUF493 domain-containing protein [Deltaproteobacteria bacterium]